MTGILVDDAHLLVGPTAPLLAVLATTLVLSPACGDFGAPAAREPSREELRDLHGLVQLRLLRGEAEPSDPYAGTDRVEVSLEYDECIRTFYERNPDYGLDGELGRKIFGSPESGWFDMCRGAEPVVCEVTEIRPSVPTSGGSGTGLTVVYSVAGHIEGRALGFGPLPARELAECTAPSVRLTSLDAVIGLDDAGERLWRVAYAQPLEIRVGELGDTLRLSSIRTTADTDGSSSGG